MKKLLALILAVLMIACLGVTAFAADVDSGDIKDSTGNAGSTSGDVKVNITDQDGNDYVPTIIYNVVITWDSLTFDVSAEKADWNAATLKYDLTNATVSDATKTITVTNNSNAAVGIAASFPDSAKTATLHDVTATLAGSDRNLESAVNRTEADTMTYTVTADGEPTSVPDMTYTISTITVTVSKVA